MHSSLPQGAHSQVPQPQPPLRFGQCTLDLEACTLADAQGTEIKLTRGEFVLLREFLRHPGRVLSRDHLSNLLSGHGCEAFERGIDMHIVRLRRKIEPDPKHPGLIVTVPGFGYKFGVKSCVATAPPVMSAATLELPLVVIVPFCSLSGDAAQDYSANAFSQEVSTILAAFPSVRVIAPANRAEGADPDMRLSGQTLGTRYALGGSVAREGARLRVMAQLVDASSGEQVWTRRYDESGEDPASLQSYFAESIAYALAGTEGIIINEEGRRAWRKSTAELTEYDYFARTQVMRYRKSFDDYDPVREIWRRGLARFPGSALLRIVMAFSYQHEVECVSRCDPISTIERAWTLAVEADPTAGLSPFTAMLHSWLLASLCQWHQGDFDRSFALARRAIGMAPYHVRAMSHLSWYVANAGRIDQAIAWAAWAIRHNPRHGFACNLAWAYYLAGRYDEAMTTLDDVGTEYAPQLAAVLVRLGRVAEARAAITSWLRSFPHASIARMALEPIREPWKQGWLDDLRVAGIPEG